ncbi:DUF4835 family protein [Sediminibacterium roseum]|uniref:DUF4835 family protein n=1 Tax=Sediminibacterium roseum TaxID=1978412 RepID=A0ABW9ZRW8_9BACT|nr:DUF4835 family protein [Sediminibacterium roseum]NCI49841.1 DUF4835 family protein [Sediminibacterium roseum]
MRNKIFLVILTACLLWQTAGAQELQARVNVVASRVNSTVDKKIFTTLQTQLNNLLNNRKWTNDQFQPNEKIECSFLLNIESVLETGVYKATLTVQAARPVFNSSYNAALINYIDPDVAFKYVEFQPVEFNENRVQGTDALAANLTAIFAYYAYMIIAMDYDSFAPKGGETYYRKAQNIITNAPEGKNISGWRVFDGSRNRYWLNENLINTRYNILHDILYTYYRNGLDRMFDAEEEARLGVTQGLTQLQAFNKENSNTMFVQFFLQGKAQELIGMFKKAPAEQKSRIVEILSEIDVINATRYKQELR